MGVCASCQMTEQLKRQRAIESSDPLQLHSVNPELTLHLRDLMTVLEVLQIVAVKLGLDVKAASWLELEFSGSVIPHQHTLWEAGLSDQAAFSVRGEEGARSRLNAEALEMDIWEAANQGKIDDVQFICSFAPERVNEQNWEGRTALHFSRDKTQVARALLTAKADPDIADQFGQVPLYYAAKDNNCKVAETLLQARADPNATGFYDIEGRSGWRPLRAAKYYKHPNMVKLLSSNGATLCEREKELLR